ncbi:unnamed protein product, partial [Mesorhabditis spiculigera]
MPAPAADNAAPAHAEPLKIAVVKPETTQGDQRRTRNGKFTLAQLRQTDALVPLQSGTNQFDSQKGKTGFGMPRNTATKVEMADEGIERQWFVEPEKNDPVIRLQSGSNQFESQKGMTAFGASRDVKGKHLKRIWELEFPEEAIQEKPINASHGNGQ